MIRKLITILIIIASVGLFLTVNAAGNDSYTISLLHFNGTASSTTFTDDAAGDSNTYNANGNAWVDTADKVFGTGSLKLDGTANTYLNTSTSSQKWALNATSTWTVDFWVKRNGDQAYYYSYLISHLIVTGWGFNWGYPATDRRISLLNAQDGVNAVNTVVPIPNMTWTHIATVNDASTNNIYMFMDGVLKQQASSTSAITWGDVNSPLYIGTQRDYLDRLTTGWFDEFRFSKGIARWTANFTPPTEEYNGAVAPTVPKMQVIWWE